MNNRNVLVGVCGLYCGACTHYRASLTEGRHLLEKAAQQGRSLEGYTCQGCRSETLYQHPGCAQCKIRSCAQEKKHFHCGLCPEFPCDQVRTLQSDGRSHHRDILANLEELVRLGSAHWLAKQEQRWKCACGRGFSWYEMVCSRCGTPLVSY